MSTKTTRALLSVAIVIAALSTLFYTTMTGSADYYMNVDELMPQAQHWYGKNLQVRGFVVENSVEKVPDTLDYRFKVKNGDSVVVASYSGVIPDTFKDGAEVVLKGRLSPDGFHAQNVTAKCPSKYEAAQTPPGAGRY